MDELLRGSINLILKFIIKLISVMLPVMIPNSEFMGLVDSSLVFAVIFINYGSYFLPLTVLCLCFGARLTYKYGMLIWKIVKWLIELIRG